MRLLACRKQPTTELKRPFESLYNAFVTSSKRAVHITYEDFLAFTEIIQCHYCDAEIKWTKYNIHRNGMAYYLDRKNNSKDYTINDVVVCCTRCNKGKSDLFTYEEWVEFGKCIRRMRETKTMVAAA